MIGTDFELFMKNSAGEHIPVPQKLDIGHKFGEQVKLDTGSMHRDNVMVELCPDQVSNALDMVTNVDTLIDQAESYLTKAMGETITLSFEPTVKFSEDALASPYAQELGCDIDWLASMGRGTKRTQMSANTLKQYRCGGGHIHVSYGTREQVEEPVAIHLADMVLGTLEATMGTQGKRRNFYGIPGLYRPKTYGNIKGVEYRTPSNLWLSSKERISAMVNNAISMQSVLRYETPAKIAEFLQEHWPVLMAQGSIVNENAEECHALIAATHDAFPNYNWRIGL